jgi:hypothetical protein
MLRRLVASGCVAKNATLTILGVREEEGERSLDEGRFGHSVRRLHDRRPLGLEA